MIKLSRDIHFAKIQECIELEKWDNKAKEEIKTLNKETLDVEASGGKEK